MSMPPDGFVHEPEPPYSSSSSLVVDALCAKLASLAEEHPASQEEAACQPQEEGQGGEEGSNLVRTLLRDHTSLSWIANRQFHCKKVGLVKTSQLTLELTVEVLVFLHESSQLHQAACALQSPTLG